MIGIGLDPAVRHERVPLVPGRLAARRRASRRGSSPSVVVLPAATLVLAVTPYISRIMRGSMIEVLESEYVTMARLKGLPERTVIWRHAVPERDRARDPGRRRCSWPGWRAASWSSSTSSRTRASAPRSSTRSRTATCRSCRRVTMLAAGGLRRDEPARGPRDDPGHAEAEDGGAMSDQTIDTAVDLGLEAAVEPVGPRRGPAAPAVARHPAQRAAARPHADRPRDRRRCSSRSRVFGPLVAPHSPTEFVAAPNSGPVERRAVRRRRARARRAQPLPARRAHRALDVGRRDRCSASAWASVVGLVAAYSRNWLDDVLMRGNDVVLAFPQIILVLLAVSALGPKLWLIVLVVAHHARCRASRGSCAAPPRRSSSATSSRRPRRSARSARGSSSASCCRT